ncbi:MAG TPA: lipopolysaccharide biosynthesis protein [Terriglobales bacterium]
MVTDNDPFAVALDAEGLRLHSVRGSFATVLSQCAKLAIQIGSQVILARLLFPAEFGLIAMVYPVAMFLQVFNDIGLGQAVVQRPTLVREQVSALFWANIAVSLVLMLVVISLAPLAAWVYGEPRLILLTIVAGLFLPFNAISIVPSALLARRMQFGQIARNEVAAIATGAIVTIICARQGFSYWSLVIGQFASTLTTITLAWLASGWQPGRPRLSLSAWNDVKFGTNITLSNLATFATTSGDNIIVGLTAGKVPLGLYDRSYNLVVRPIGQMMMPLSRVALPLLSRLVDKPDEYRATYLQIFRIATLLIVPAMLVCTSDGATIIRVLLGPHWTEAAPVFSWLCVGGLTSGIYTSTFWLLISQDRSQELRTFTAIAAAINVTSYLIGSFWGVVGIAMAASLSFVFVSTPLLLFAALRRGPIRFGDVAGCAIPFILETILIYAVLRYGLDRLPLQGFSRIAAGVLISYGLFVGIASISADNRRLLQAGARALKGLLPARARLNS